MTKQHNTQTTYLLNNYLITIERINNDVNGNPRFKAIITSLKGLNNDKHTLSYVYTFKGHYDAEEGEADFILNYHLNKRNK